MWCKVRFSLLFAGVWASAAFAVALLLGSLNWLDYYRLSRNGVDTVALVTRKEPNNHLAVHYTYIVDSREYHGQGHAASAQSLEAIKVGDAISVRYSDGAPHVSCWGDPKRLLANETMAILLASFFIPTVIVGLLYIRLNRRLQRFRKATSIVLLALSTIATSCSSQSDRRAAETAVGVFHARLSASIEK